MFWGEAGLEVGVRQLHRRLKKTLGSGLKPDGLH